MLQKQIFTSCQADTLTPNCFPSPEELKEKLQKYVDGVNAHKPGFIKVVRHSKQEGLIRSRVSGWRAATAPVVALFDAHVEFSVGWYVPPSIFLTQGPFPSTGVKLLTGIPLAYKGWVRILSFLVKVQTLSWTQAGKMCLCCVIWSRSIFMVWVSCWSNYSVFKSYWKTAH